MNRVFSWVQNFLVRQVVILLLVGFSFLGLQVVNSSYMLVASAETVTSPEGIYYKGTPDESINKNINNNADSNNKLGENAKSSLKEAADNVREKLNLDEPLPRSTKEFLKSTEERVEKTVEPVTGTRKGYYQIP
ncbi:MAG: hypothetical protein HC785_09595 [Calothrix sp. CSU_2_0]|nr:hypothetical protein [Calothrix sp. CSU_2_0]